MHLHRAKYIPKGGPDGGDGGRGGHIILRASAQFWTLIHLKYRKHIKAEDGQKGGAALCKGKNGADIVLDVPVGTVVKDAESGEQLFDLNEDGQEQINSSTLTKTGRSRSSAAAVKAALATTTSRLQPTRHLDTLSPVKRAKKAFSFWNSSSWRMWGW